MSFSPGDAGTLVIGQFSDPKAEEGQVVVRVRACSLNYPDVLIIEDRYQIKAPRPFSPGSDVAGTIEQVGAGVSRFSVGDRVWGTIDWGGLAELAAVDAHKLFPLPDSVTFETAAAASLTYRTAYHGLVDRGVLRAGERLLVLGAGGGVGCAATELGKILGAHVIAAASSRDRLDLASHMGANETFLYPRTGDAAQLARTFAECLPESPDVIFDTVGGAYTAAALRRLSYGGRLLTVGFTAGIPSIPLNLVLLKSCQLIGVNLGALRGFRKGRDEENAEMLSGLMVSCRIRPAISERIGLDAAAGALVRMKDRKVTGKIVVLL